MDSVQEFVLALQVQDTRRVACPSCSPERKKRKLREMVVSKSEKGWIYHCHHCGISGGVASRKDYSFIPARIKMEKTLNVVSAFVGDDLQEHHYEWLKSRGISKATADAARLFAAERWFSALGSKADCIGFPYYQDGQVKASKYRAITSKAFTQDSGGAQSFWGIDLVQSGEPIVIVEGEMDALAAREAGVNNVISVPSGAPLKVADGKVLASEDKKFQFVWSAHDLLKAAPHVVIATDTDGPGQALAEELARRIGKAKCRIASLPAKDLNEVLLQHGIEGVVSALDNAEPYPVEGLSSATKYEDRLRDLWDKGNGKGASTGFEGLDQIYTVAPGQLTVVTGYPSHGKSNFVDQLMVNLGKQHDWKFAVCSFENQPEVHISRLMEIYSGKRFFEGSKRMSESERDDAFTWVDEHFLFLDSEGVAPATIDSVLDRAQAAVSRMGIRGLVIDPYNYIDVRNQSASETASISDLLTRVQAFAKAYGVHVWFIAHPAKITRSGVDLPRPDGMAISGSMAWWAKADCGITVHRIERGVEIAVWKCRYRWVGTQGETVLGYDPATGTYQDCLDFF